VSIKEYSNDTNENAYEVESKSQLFDYVRHIIRTVEAMSFFFLKTTKFVKEVQDPTLKCDSQVFVRKEAPLDSIFNHLQELLETLTELGNLMLFALF